MLPSAKLCRLTSCYDTQHIHTIVAPIVHMCTVPVQSTSRVIKNKTHQIPQFPLNLKRLLFLSIVLAVTLYHH